MTLVGARVINPSSEAVKPTTCIVKKEKGEGRGEEKEKERKRKRSIGKGKIKQNKKNQPKNGEERIQKQEKQTKSRACMAI